jgi:hypothetical protein
MARTSLNDKLKRDIKYTNKDFGELRVALINYAKTYFPQVYSDFNESSPGMMFIEMASYIGDVLNFYSDIQLQESFLYTVNERMNLYNLSQGLGYKPKTLVPAQVDLDLMQLVPAIGEGSNVRPDFNYALNIEEGLVATANTATSGIYFRTVHPVDFRYSSSYDPTEISVYSIDNNTGDIQYYLLKKKVKAVEGQIKSATYEFTSPKPYDKIVITDANVSEIIDITDSDDNKWYEVQYLAQDIVPVSIRNIPYNDPELSQYNSSVPYLLSYKQTERRFITRLRKDELTEIQFGAGMSTEADEEILPNPYNVGIGLDYFERIEDVSIDPMNFLYSKTYGLTPSNTTLTVRYSTSNGISGNVTANSINSLVSFNASTPFEVVSQDIYNSILESLTVNNPEAAYGGLNKKELDLVREEAMAHFAAQNRAVTKEDYILRCYTMPDRFGAIAKVYVEQDIQISSWNSYDKIPNPYALNLYVLSYDSNGNFVHANRALKENLRQYLRQYRLLTDAIQIKDPYIINIGINYDLVTRPSYNSYEVLLKCNNKLIELLDNQKMEIGAPINIASIMVELDKIEGVQSVHNIEIENLYDSNLGYSGNLYSVKEATRNNMLYPSMDPCVFEVKYPKNDIKGRIIDL